MRILLYEPSGRGGMKHYTEGLAKGLLRLATAVSILTSTSEGPSADGYRVLRRLRDPGRHVSPIVWPFDRALSGFYNSMVRALESSLGYDVCHLQEVSPLFDWATLRMVRVPLVLTVHDVRPHETRWWKSPRLLRAVYSAVDHIIVHSRHNAEVLMEESHVEQSMISVIPHGLDPIPWSVMTRAEARRQLSLPTDAPIALAFGAIRHDKGLDLALQALSLQRDWYLVVAGRANDASPLIALANQLGVESRVCWRIGFIPDDLITPYFIAADVVVLPYKPSFESQSGVLFQAYRHHIPVVVTDVGSLGETVREDGAGIVVPPNDPRAFADGMVMALRLGKNILWNSLEQKYSWDHIAMATIEVYKKVLARSSRGDIRDTALGPQV